jgi:Phosphotransferase enzyme family
MDRVPSGVLLQLAGVTTGVRQQALAGSWGSRDLIRLFVAGRADIVVKRWTGADRIARGSREAEILAHLTGMGFRHTPRAVPFGSSIMYRGKGGVTAWTAQEFVPGPAPGRQAVADPGFSRRLGQALAAFHECGTIGPADSGHASRLGELHRLPVLVGGLASPDAELVLRAYERSCRALDDVLVLPRCQLHGDVNLENIIESPSALTLIDLEFARVDIRLLDLAGLAAPGRTADGTVRGAPPQFQRSVAAAYRHALGQGRLAADEAEMSLLPVVSLMHFLLIVADQLRLRSPHVSCVLPVVADLTLQASSWKGAAGR